ncbi:hypothetical protein FHR83_002893 [Actinoplanes campanulatus]|uniref:Red chlorophyll catabolite reductase n=1 Tax=Actinoplanes campanulatus TaxID=113559 RepID=A0A7W5FED0_9ACTN|nr:hypothetical protein [Actinoplanes campanulatus]MBB3095230.1 hypothetical protein [Actinoplanes campanulatus]GGN24310.1 hypothetical protein GCM10010109_39760 [Actinoplanes campanulatus]GID34835.1 hypothetical protein Aca09nite_13410 [Actinoplanes campanulatus]
MSLPEALSDTTLDKILARFAVSLDSERALTSPMSPDPVGKIKIWRGTGTVVKVVNVSLVVPMIGLDSHMIFAFTAPGSGVPHFTLDSVANGENYAFHLDLIPRIDLATSLDYLDSVYEPLTAPYQEVSGREGLTPAHLTPRQYALMSPWMLVNRATAAAFEGIGDAVDAYLSHWAALVESGVKAEGTAARDAAHRELLFSPEIDPVWKQTVRLLGEEQSESVRLALVSND